MLILILRIYPGPYRKEDWNTRRGPKPQTHSWAYQGLQVLVDLGGYGRYVMSSLVLTEAYIYSV